MVDKLPRRSAVDRILYLYLGLVLILAAVAGLTVFVKSSILHRPYPENSLLFRPEARYSDFTGSALKISHFGEPGMLVEKRFGGPGYTFFPYPLPTVYVYLFFIRLFPKPLTAYLSTVVTAFVLAALWLLFRLRALVQRSALPYLLIFISAISAFPMFYLYDRANIEGVPWILIAFGLVAFYRKLYPLAAVLIACAASLKLFPAILLLLFIAKRQYRALVLGIICLIAVTLLAWAGIGPTVLQAAKDGAAGNRVLFDQYVTQFKVGEEGWDHSLFGVMKEVVWVLLGRGGVLASNTVTTAIRKMVPIYGAVVCLGFASLYVFKLRRLPVLNQLIIYLILSIVLPFVSNEYTLVHMYFAWAAFLLYLAKDVRTGSSNFPLKNIALILACFAVIFSAQSYWIVHNTHTINGQIKFCALVGLLWIVLRNPMYSSSLGDTEPPLLKPSPSPGGVVTMVVYHRK